MTKAISIKNMKNSASGADANSNPTPKLSTKSQHEHCMFSISNGMGGGSENG